MVSAEDLKSGNFLNIMITLILTGLGFYIAIILVEAMRITMETLLPPQDNRVVAAWIIFGVSLLVVAIIVVIFIWLFDGRNSEKI
ncbi:Hypothetical protein HVR_LOCUS322 [uncultured virus]|nr:Hypothetical protein HVR_LOCUS322 [uncultured virus]